MVAGCVFTEEYAVAVSADRMWKVAFSGDRKDALPKACAGFIDAVVVEGDGGPGCVSTLTLSPAAVAASGAGSGVMKTRLVARDDAARVVRSEVMEGGKVSAELKSHVVEARLEEAGEGACVAKVKVEYERLDGGGELAPEDQAALAAGYRGLLNRRGVPTLPSTPSFADRKKHLRNSKRCVLGDGVWVKNKWVS